MSKENKHIEVVTLVKRPEKKATIESFSSEPCCSYTVEKDDEKLVQPEEDIYAIGPEDPNIDGLFEEDGPVFYDRRTNEVFFPDSGPADHFTSLREELLISVLVIWRFMSLFMGIAIIVVELLYWAAGCNDKSFVISFKQETAFFGHQVYISFIKAWRPICMGSSIVILLAEIIYWTMQFSTKDIFMKYPVIQYDPITTRSLVVAVVEAWKPVCILCVIILILIGDIINWTMSDYYVLF